MIKENTGANAKGYSVVFIEYSGYFMEGDLCIFLKDSLALV